jgi:DNA ligase-4
MDFENQIRIFSKSKRDSTMDRFATLPIIRAALGLPQVSDPCTSLTGRLSFSVKPSIRRSVILEAEMVAYSERTGAIDGKLFCT